MLDPSSAIVPSVDPTARIMPGAYIETGAWIGRHAKIGANAVVLAQGSEQVTRIGADTVIGANSTIMAGVAVGAGAQVQPGSVVTRSVPPLAIVAGNPACITGYTRTHSSRHSIHVDEQRRCGAYDTRVESVTLHHLKVVHDMRGSLSVGHFSEDIPFSPQRYFLVFGVPSSETRGEHAHRRCHQFLIAVQGRISVVADDGDNREEFLLDRPNLGLYLPALTWGIQYQYQATSVLLVFASELYEADDYIRDYDEFLQIKRATEAPETEPGLLL